MSKLNVVDSKLKKAQMKLQELNSAADSAKQQQLQAEKRLSALRSELA